MNLSSIDKSQQMEVSSTSINLPELTLSLDLASSVPATITTNIIRQKDYRYKESQRQCGVVKFSEYGDNLVITTTVLDVSSSTNTDMKSNDAEQDREIVTNVKAREIIQRTSLLRMCFRPDVTNSKCLVASDHTIPSASALHARKTFPGRYSHFFANTSNKAAVNLDDGNNNDEVGSGDNLNSSSRAADDFCLWPMGSSISNYEGLQLSISYHTHERS